MSTDLTALKRLINLPADVKGCEWQTGKLAQHGGDWWVVAILDVGAGRIGDFLPGRAEKSVFETPPGLKLTASFAALKALPDAQLYEPGRVRLITDVNVLLSPYYQFRILESVVN